MISTVINQTDRPMRLKEEQISSFRTKGYVTVPALYGREEIALLKSSLDNIKKMSDRPEVVRERTNNSVRLIYGAHHFDEAYRRLSQHPRWVSAASQLLDDDVYIHQMRINPKAAYDGQGWWWHQDFATWRYEDGMPTARALMIGLFLDDMTACNGPLMVIPGSHTLGHIDENVRDHDKTGYTVMDLPQSVISRLTSEGGVEALTGPAGTMLFMHCNLVHGSVGNITPFERTIVYINVNACSNAITKLDRAPWFANRDFSPIRPIGDDALRALASAA